MQFFLLCLRKRGDTPQNDYFQGGRPSHWGMEGRLTSVLGVPVKWAELAATGQDLRAVGRSVPDQTLVLPRPGRVSGMPCGAQHLLTQPPNTGRALINYSY